MGKCITIVIIIFKFEIAPLMSHSRLQKAGPPLHSILPPDVSGPTTNKMDLKELLGGFSFFVR